MHYIVLSPKEEMIYSPFRHINCRNCSMNMKYINRNIIIWIYYKIQSFLYSFFITQMYLLPRRQATLTIMALLQPQLLLLLPITTIITTSIHLWRHWQMEGRIITWIIIHTIVLVHKISPQMERFKEFFQHQTQHQWQPPPWQSMI